MSKVKGNTEKLRKKLNELTAEEFLEMFGDFWPMSPGPNEDEFKRWVKIRAGVSFDFMAAKASTLYYNQIYFVDRANGSDGQTGEDWDHPKATINDCMTALETKYGSKSAARGRHFLIVFQSRLTTDNQFAAKQTIDVSGVDLVGAGKFYGMGGGWNSCFINQYAVLAADTDLSGLVSTKAGLQIDTDEVTVQGLKFYAPDVAGAMNHIAVNDAHGGRSVAILDNTFQGDLNGTYSVDGVGLNGCETGLVKGNEFYFCGNAIVLGGGGTRYASKCIVEGNRIFDPAYGIRLYNASTTENLIKDNSIRPKNTYGMTFVNGILVAAGCVGNAFEGNKVFHETKATAYSYGGANAREWILNYYGAAGGTLYDGT